MTTVPIRPTGGDRRPAELGGAAGWRLASTGARFIGLVLAGCLIGGGAFALLVLALLALVLIPVALVFGWVSWLSLPFLTVMAWLARPLGRMERHRVRLMTGTRVAEAYRPLRGSLRSRARMLLGDSGTWRDLAWLAAQSVAGPLGAAFLAGLVIGPVVMIMTPYWVLFSPGSLNPLTVLDEVPLSIVLVVGWRARCRLPVGLARLSGWLLAPSEGARLRAQVGHLAETRAETVDARAAELRRIERDLHDGAQARLVSLTMSLGMAEEEFDRRPDAARQLVAEARASASTALNELRHLVRGIHPPVLTERGLGGAVEALALASAVPVEADVQLDERLSVPLESALYFVIAEALANVARHSDASWAFVRLWRDQGILRLMVRDDGQGGADPARGSGLRGIQQRLAAFDGSLTLSSPPGGPTELFAQLPCRQ